MSTLTVIGITAGPASAQPGPTQTGGHIVAGSRLGVRDGMCSAGLVVKNDARLSNLSAYNRATRYVVTAAHCFDRGSDDVSYGGEVVGQAVWKDAASDLALVKVAPIVHNNQACAPSSGVFHCVGSVTYEPRALGRVILASLRTRSIDKLPVVATGAPPAVGVFCASGAWTGPDCSLSSARSTPNMGLREGERLAVSRGAQFVSGDSGGIICSPNGVAYGIMTRSVSNASNNFIAWTPINAFFERVPGSYSLAPA
jgi:hypothetical protein